MQHLAYQATAPYQWIDMRSQTAFQAGHLKGALNLIPGNFKKYAGDLLQAKQPIALVLDADLENQLPELERQLDSQGFTQLAGYLLIADVPQADLETQATITAADFINLPAGDFTLLDVRHPDEITRPAPEKQLQNIALEELAFNYERLQPGQTIYTLCGSGNRATAAASFLAVKGYQPVVIEGGMKAVQALNP